MYSWLRLIRRLATCSWWLTKLFYRTFGIRLKGEPDDPVWYFAFGANMHEGTFCQRRGMQPSEWRVARISGYRLRFNLDGWPPGRSAPANISLDHEAEVWGVSYRITRRALVLLDGTEGVPGWGYRHLWIEARDTEDRELSVVTYIADGKPDYGNPSLRYITLLREGAKAHGLPAHHVRMLEQVQPASE